MNEMEAARFNIYWFLSFIAPAAIMIIAAYRHKRYIMVLGALLSLVTTFTLCNMAVSEKWHMRSEIADTEQEREYATEDGANLAFTLLVFAPFEALFYTSFWGFIGWRNRRWIYVAD